MQWLLFGYLRFSGVIMYAMMVGKLPFTTPYTDQYRRIKLLQQIEKGLVDEHHKEMAHLSLGQRSTLLLVGFSLHTPILPTPIFSLYIPVALWCSGLSDLSLIAISCSSQCSTTSVTKAMLCIILCGMWHIKDFLLLIGKSSPWNGSSGFPLSIHELFFTIIWSTPCNHK